MVSSYFNVLSGERMVRRHPSSGARKYYHMDLLGSTRAVVEGAAVVESYDYDPWGLLLPGRTLGSGTREGFASKERDAETGLDYFGARHYMAALGRWTTVDPPADSFPSWSPYNYVFNNPAGLTDPDGRCPPCAGALILGGGAAAVAAAAAAAEALLATKAQGIGAAIESAVDAARDKLQIKFVTYTRTNPGTGQVYSGRTSGFGDPQRIVNARVNRHPDRLKGFGPAIVDSWSAGIEGYGPIRGREQQLIDFLAELRAMAELRLT